MKGGLCKLKFCTDANQTLPFKSQQLQNISKYGGLRGSVSELLRREWANSDKTTFVTEIKRCQKNYTPFWNVNPSDSLFYSFWSDPSITKGVNLFDTDFWSQKNWNKGQLRVPVGQSKIIDINNSHTFLESHGRALSHGTSQYMAYMVEKMSNFRFWKPSKQDIWDFLSLFVGAQFYKVKSAILLVWVVLVTFLH